MTRLTALGSRRHARPFSGLSVVAEGLRMVYEVEGEQVVALADADLVVAPGESVAVLGPSGSGKSTLLTLVAGLQRPVAGEIWVGRHQVTRLAEAELLALRGSDVAMIAQGPARNVLTWATVEDNVLFAQQGSRTWVRRTLPSPRSLLDSLGMGALARRKVAQLSGGEKQRLALALGMSTRPGLLLLDEPTSQLDHESRDAVTALITTIVEDFGTTVLAVTHDEEVAQVFHRTVRVEAGHLVGGEAVSLCRLCARPLRDHDGAPDGALDGYHR